MEHCKFSRSKSVGSRWITERRGKKSTGDNDKVGNARDKRRHCYTESHHYDNAFVRSYSPRGRSANDNSSESEEELIGKTRSFHIGDAGIRKVKCSHSSTQTEFPKPDGRLEKMKVWWYSHNPQTPKPKQGSFEEKVVSLKQSPDHNKRYVKRLTCTGLQHPGPIYDSLKFTLQHPWTRQAVKKQKKKPERPIRLEDIINWAEVERIINRRSRYDFEEVPNTNPAYDIKGYRWGVPVSVYDYCPQRSTWTVSSDSE